MNDDILMSYGAVKPIIKEVDKFEVETGGIIVGTLGNPITVVAAGSSGRNSLHHVTQFTSDPVADKECLAKARQEYGLAGSSSSATA